MEKKVPSKASMYFGWFVKRFVLMLFDICVFYGAYFLALVIRFYVNSQFRQIAVDKYLPAFAKFAPYYAVISVIVFVAFKLYDNRWKHAGLHDLNRIFLANAITALVHILGTLLFVCRMPITYYFIGAVLQFFLITASRFSYRLLVLERSRLRWSRQARLNVMIVGVGETARVLRRQIENDRNNVAKPVCIFAYKENNSSKMMNGLPVLTQLDKMAEYLNKYGVKCVILADPIMPPAIRRQLRELCAANGVEVQDFSGYLKQEGPGLTPRMLLETVAGPVELVVGGSATVYENSEQALMALHGNYTVQRVFARGEHVVIEVKDATVILNDVHQDWVKDTEEETGNEISFF